MKYTTKCNFICILELQENEANSEIFRSFIINYNNVILLLFC